MTSSGAVMIRWAFPDDGVALARLAALDSVSVPSGPVLLAEVEGIPWAALSLADGTTIADPFRPSAAIVELLRARGAQLRGPDEAGSRKSRRGVRGLALGARRVL